MTFNKYTELDQVAKPPKKVEVIKSDLRDASSQAGSAPDVVPSKEHSRPIIPHITYTTDMESDGFVRIYDGIVAQRDEVFIVDRKELVGKTPEQIQKYFSLSFVPRLICDARIPIGNRILAGKLTNEAGKQVYIFKALTALELSSERDLTPENILPVKLETHIPSKK